MNTRQPKFILYIGPMFAAKSTNLLSSIDRYLHQKLTVVAFKPKIDNRYSESMIKTHTGGTYPAVAVSTGAEILDSVMNAAVKPDVVAVDEAFMIDGSAEALIRLFREGTTILVSSIDMSAGCQPFTEIQEMMPWATHIEKLSAVCAVCYEDAYYTQKKFDEPVERIRVGGADLYEPRCFRCHTGIVLSWDNVEKNWTDSN